VSDDYCMCGVMPVAGRFDDGGVPWWVVSCLGCGLTACGCTSEEDAWKNWRDDAFLDVGVDE